MAKGYSARNGFGGSAGMMRQQQQMQQKLARMQQDMEAAQKNAVQDNAHTLSALRWPNGQAMHGPQFELVMVSVPGYSAHSLSARYSRLLSLL